jgi:uncharacterized protein (TIGR02246 family)
MKADPKTEAEVMNAIKQCFEAFAKRDLNAMLAFFAPDPDVVVIGTGRDEKGIGFAEVKAIFERAFSQFNEASFEFGWHSVSVAGPLAWLATDITFHVKAGGREISQQIRLTSIMEKRGDRWLILQAHDSVPDRDQVEGEAFPRR